MSRSDTNRKVGIILIVLLCAMYIATRFWRLTESCLWFDEIFSVHAAEHSWNSILGFVAQDLIHPPLFYLLLKLWIGIGGEDLFWLRLLPVIFSITALVPLFLLMRELKRGYAVTLLALFLIAFNGSLIKYAQEVRMYSLLMCVSLFSMWLFSRYFIKGRGLVPLIIINLIMVYSHYFGWFVVLSEVAAIVIFQRIKIRAILIMFGSALLAFLPWAIAVISYARAGAEVGQNIGWMQKPMPVNIVQLILSLAEPFYFATSNAVPYSIYKVSLPILLILATALVLFCVKWNRNKAPVDSEPLWMLIIFTGMPVVIAFTASWVLPYSIWGTRHLIIVFVPLAILFAIALYEVEQNKLRIALLPLAVLFTGYAFFLTTQREIKEYSWCIWAPDIVTARETGPGKIYVFEDLVAYHFWYAAKLHGLADRGPIKAVNIDGLKEDKAYFLPRGFDDIQNIDAAEINDPQIFIAYRAKDIDETKEPLKTFLDREYRIKFQRADDAVAEKAILVYLEK